MSHYNYGGGGPSHHGPHNPQGINPPNNSSHHHQPPSYNSMAPIQPTGGPLLSTGPLAGPSPSSNGLSHGLQSLHSSHQSHHFAPSAYDQYSPYPPQGLGLQHQQGQQQQHISHYGPPPPQSQQNYVPRPISAASTHHSPAPPSSAIPTTHSQLPSPQLAHGSTTPRTGGLPADPQTVNNATESPPPPPVAKARSSVACALCRKQKMKCEGPDKKPCRRCRAAGVECVFEAPPVSAPRPRGTGVTEAWVESRLSAFDQRVTALEDNSTLVRSPRDSTSNASTVDHERRIAALEAQIYALQLQAANPPPPPQHQRHAQIEYHQPSMHTHNPHSSPQQNSFANSAYGLPSPANVHSMPSFVGGSNSLHSRYDSTSSLKHEGEPQGGYANDGMGEMPSTKRWKGDEKTGRPAGNLTDGPDFISRGVVTEEEAAMCFDSYFLTFAANTPLSDQRNLSFTETRQRSPLYLATIVSIGARSLSRFETFHASLREALYSVSEMFMPDNDGSKLVSMLTIKAIILLGLYHSMPHLLLASGMLGFKMGLRTALDEYDELQEEDKKSKIGRTLIGKGRMMFVSYLWTAFYTYQAGEPTCFDVSLDVLRRQLDILSNSPYAEPVTDQVIRTNLEECAILLDAFNKLGAGMDTHRWSVEQVRNQVDQCIKDLERWSKLRADMMVVVSQWGDSRELKAILPFHHGRQCLMRYIFRPEIPLHEYDRNDPKLREYAKMAMESAVVILRWGVESRIWMPFSIVGGYVHHVNIPTALHHLFTAARLFPSEADFIMIRPMLHRLLKQCDVTIRGPASTKREISRAELTKAEVLEFDRFAFEASGEESLGPDGADDQPGLVGHEIGQSLASFRLELNLWSSPLRSVESDN